MHRAIAFRLLSLIAAALVGSGCQTLSPADGGDSSEPVAARVGEGVITVAELDAYIKDGLFERETRGMNPSRTYDVRSKALSQMLRERALDLAAASQGLTPEALLEAELSKTDPVDDEAVRTFYEENRAQLQGTPLDAVASGIREHLEAERRREVVEKVVDATHVEIALERPRVDVPGDGPSRGPADAPVTLVEFSDFQCPYCRRARPVLDSLAEKFPEDLRIVYRHLPLESLHPHARAGAEASACAAEAGRFWEYHDLLFENPRAMTEADLRRYAEEVGLDAEEFDACLSSRRHAAAIDADIRAADAAGISGTPAFVVNGIVLFGLQPEAAIEKVIREELARGDS